MPNRTLDQPPTFAIRAAGAIENLPALLGFIENVCEHIDADDETKYALRLAVEEVCTNLIVHGYKGRAPGPVEVVVSDADDRVTLVIHDRSPPFDPDNAPPPDLNSDAEHRRIGGLGWHLVKKMVDEIRYVPGTPSGNQLTLVKRKAANRN